MLEIICHIALGVLLIIAFLQDWKHRAISWVIFPLLLIVAGLIFWTADLSKLTLVFNMVFLTIVIGCLFLYVSFKRGELTNIFKADLGLGDVLFLIAITPLFMDRNYILFFITGMIVSGLVHLAIAGGKKNVKIPLAGYLALYIIGLKSFEFISSTDLFYTAIL
ncbi:MAG: hypothetical protein GQ574_22915 [Crocinitomix sp.]|nr:hypothetical protein [Crocinitomix sp.]